MESPPIGLNHAKRRFRIHSGTRGQIVRLATPVGQLIGLLLGYEGRGGVMTSHAVMR